MHPNPSWLAIVLVVVGLIVCVGLPMRLLSRSGRENIWAAVLLTVGICGGLVLLATTRISTSQSVVEVQYARTMSGSASDAKPPATVSVTELVQSSSAVVAQAEVQSTPDGNVMWLPLSSEVLQQLISADGVQAIARLNESLPPELRQAYAMIPLSAPSPTAAPVVERALAAPVIRNAIASTQVRDAIAGFMNLALNYQPNQPVATVTSIESSQADFEPPEWISNPGIGQLLIESEFVESDVSAVDALRPVLTNALLAHATEVGRKQYHVDGSWQELVQVSLTEQAMKACIRETATRHQIVTALGTEEPMHKTYALVEVPPAIERQVIRVMRTAVQRDRAIAVSVAVVGLWLSWMLLGVWFRTSAESSWVRRLTAAPVAMLLILPCVGVTIALVAAMLEGKTFDFGMSDHPVICRIDTDR